MSIEIRHTEKSLLFDLLLLSHGKTDLQTTISRLQAAMEPDDVIQVEKRIEELLKISSSSSRTTHKHETIQELFANYDGGFFQTEEIDWGKPQGSKA